MRSLIVVTSLLASFYGCYAVFYPSYTYSYKLSILIKSEGKTYEASNVWQVTAQFSPGFPGPEARRVSYSLKGEAVVIDVPGHSPVFTLLRTEQDVDSLKYLPRNLFEAQIPNDPKQAESALQTLYPTKATASVPRKDYPMLVAFKDVNDPTSVYQLSPDDLSPALGAGARITSVTITMTDAPATIGIEKRLGWLGAWKQKGGNISGQIFFNSPPNPEKILILTDFVQGL